MKTIAKALKSMRWRYTLKNRENFTA